MGECLGVGLGLEAVAAVRQGRPQRVGVLDDPVVDQRDTPVTIDVRMRVALRGRPVRRPARVRDAGRDRKSTRLNSSHLVISYAVFCLKKKKETGNAMPEKSQKWPRCSDCATCGIARAGASRGGEASASLSRTGHAPDATRDSEAFSAG